MSDTTDSTEQMQSTPDADGRGQLVNDGGVATLVVHEGTGLEITLGNDGTLSDPKNSVDWTQFSDHKKKTMSNAIDGKIGHIGNEIDMTSRKEGCTRWYDEDVGSTTIILSALLEEKGPSAELGLLYEEVRTFCDEKMFDHKIWLHKVWEVRFDANMDIKSVAVLRDAYCLLHSEREDG